MEDRYRKTREAIRKATKAEISVFRDVMLKQTPGLFDDDKDGRAIVPAKVAGGTPSEDSSDDAAAAPPDWAMDVDKDGGEGEAADRDALTSALREKLPFEDDIEVYESLRARGSIPALVEVLCADLPDSMQVKTSTADFTNLVVCRLFTDSYIEEHIVPENAAPPPGDEYSPTRVLPPVPKKVLAALQIIAVNYESAIFETNTYWKQVRMHFPELSLGGSTKPTATDLFQQGQAAVNAEEEAAKAAKSKSAYDAFQLIRQEYDSEEDEEMPEAGTSGLTTAPVNVTMDTTTLQLRNRTVTARTTELLDVNRDGRRSSVKQMTKDEKEQEADITTKKSKDKK